MKLARYSVLKQFVAVLQQLYALLQLADELPVLLCVLSVWLFDDSYLQVVNFNQSFFSAFWTIKGIILQNSVLPNFITGFAPTNRTQYPFAFHHN